MDNVQRLNDALALALADEKFIGDKTKVDKAIDALTPKSSVSATFKRLQGNANKDFLDKQDKGVAGYTEQTRAAKMKEYVFEKFKSYMEASKTTVEATKLFNAAYPQDADTKGEEEADPATEAKPAVGVDAAKEPVAE